MPIGVASYRQEITLSGAVNNPAAEEARDAGRRRRDGREKSDQPAGGAVIFEAALR